MAKLVLSAFNSNTEITSSLEYSLRRSLSEPHNWQESNVFVNIPHGTYYGSARNSIGQILAQGTWSIESSENLAFEQEYPNGGEIWITQLEHGKTKISSVLIIDKATGWSLGNNFRIITNNLPPYDEGVAISVEPNQSVVVRIY